jgi:hypothetical protein
MSESRESQSANHKAISCAACHCLQNKARGLEWNAQLICKVDKYDINGHFEIQPKQNEYV